MEHNFNSNIGVYSNHPLIINNEKYSIKKRFLTVHSSDRDNKKWKKSSEFQINLPELYEYIYTIKLINIQIPNSLYNFTNALQNTKLTFTYTDLDASPATSIHTITLDDGYYTGASLAIALQNKMNESLSLQMGTTNPIHGTDVYFPIVCKYDTAKNKMIFGSTEGPIAIRFDTEEIYTDSTCGNTVIKSIFNNPTHWGLGYYLGYEKTTVSSTDFNIATSNFNNKNGGLILSHESTAWLAPTHERHNLSHNTVVSVIEPQNRVNLHHNNKIYMELDKYNTINELEPVMTNTTQRFNNNESFKTNGSFAVIPVRNLEFNQTNESTLGHLNIKSLFYPPIKNIRKLKFKFRDHRDNLIDFKDQDISFTLEFGCLKKGGERNISTESLLSEIA